MRPVYDAQEMKRLRSKKGHVHSRFGDLARHDAVVIPEGRPLFGDYRERPFHFVHLSVTGQCNARCKGCINGMTFGGHGPFAAEGLPETVPERDAKAVKHLLGAGGDKVLCLYGGEPLLAIDRIEALLTEFSRDHGPEPRLMLYTNGQLISKALASSTDVMSRIWLYSVSIDGGEAQHNRVRRGTDLAAIREGLRRLKGIRQGPALMWSTLREGQSLLDCFREFLRLEEEGSVEHFFWHWIETGEVIDDIGEYASRYEEDLRQIMNTCVDALGAGKVLSVVHINELLLYLLTGRRRKTTGCGIEVEGNYDIMGGRIYTCADLPTAEAIGHIGEDGTPLVETPDLSQFVAYKKDLGCSECGVHAYCGGRCPVQGLTSGAERLLQYCQLMRIHVGTVIEYLPRVAEIMARRSIPVQRIYDESAFFAQFTDVTP